MPDAPALRLIVVDDSDDDYQIFLRELARGGHAVATERVDTAADLRAAIARGECELVVTDWVIPGFGGAGAIAIAREAGLPCIVVSGTVDAEAAADALRAGALDFVSKDKPTMFAPAIERALPRRQKP
jgi:DNA-binding NtrC family response regulator